MRLRVASTSFALAFLLAGSACQPDPTLRVESGSCRLRTTLDVAFSADLAAEMCAVNDRLQRALGLPPEASSLDYNLYESSGASTKACEGAARPDAAACAPGGKVYSSEAFHVHEIVHTLLFNSGLEGTAALQEGAAMVYGCESLLGESEPELPLEHLVSPSAFYAESSTGYPAAASFVSFLLDRGGEVTFAELLGGTERHSSMERLDEAFRVLYGEPLADVHEAWQAEGPQPNYRICRPVYPCGAPPLAETEDTIGLVRGVSPSTTPFGVSGLSESVSTAGVVRTFTADFPGELHIEAHAPSASVSVISCDRRPNVMDVAQDTRILDARAPIEPGRYALWLTARVLEGDQSEIEAEFRMTIE